MGVLGVTTTTGTSGGRLVSGDRFASGDRMVLRGVLVGIGGDMDSENGVGLRVELECSNTSSAP